MNEVLSHLTIIYKIKDYDWMNFKITRDNPLTYHHIKKEEFGGEKTYKNGAPLTKLAHTYLHQIEELDPNAFYLLSKQFKRINDSKAPITKEDIRIIEKILKDFETKYDKELRIRIKNIRYNPKLLKSIKGTRDIFSPTNIRMVMQLGIDPSEPVKKKNKKKRKK